MKVEARYLVENRLRRDVDVRRELFQGAAECVKGGGSDQQRLNLERARRHQPLDDQPSFSDEQSLRRQPCMIADVRVRCEVRIAGAANAVDQSVSGRVTERLLRW